jgi:hypothetical protein
MEHCEGKSFEFTSLWAVSLEGSDEPVPVYEVKWAVFDPATINRK